MSSNDKKYRIHELAKDFGVTSKVVDRILIHYGYPVKNHMQILTPEEISIVMSYLLTNETAPSSNMNQHTLLIKWSDDDYYVGITVKNLPLSHEEIVKLCSNHAMYFDNYEQAKQYAETLQTADLIEIEHTMEPLPPYTPADPKGENDED